MRDGWGTAAAVGPLAAALLAGAATWARDTAPSPGVEPVAGSTSAAAGEPATTEAAGSRLDQRVADAQRRVIRLQRRLREVQNGPVRGARPVGPVRRVTTRAPQQEAAPPADTTSGAS